MQPKSGDTSRSAHTPQNAKSVARSETISRLSVERLRNSELEQKAEEAAQRQHKQVHENRLSDRLKSAAPAAATGKRNGDGDAVGNQAHHVVERHNLQQRLHKVAFHAVWRMVMTVDAGAVAEAHAASTAQNARSSPE